MQMGLHLFQDRSRSIHQHIYRSRGSSTYDNHHSWSKAIKWRNWSREHLPSIPQTHTAGQYKAFSTKEDQKSWKSDGVLITKLAWARQSHWTKPTAHLSLSLQRRAKPWATKLTCKKWEKLLVSADSSRYLGLIQCAHTYIYIYIWCNKQ